MGEDIAFMRNILQLPNIKTLKHKTNANISDLKLDLEIKNGDARKTSKRFIEANRSNSSTQIIADYLSQLTSQEINLLYTAYYHDFLVYGYG